jgi:alkylated DNA repair dioxygenase AlkB
MSTRTTERLELDEHCWLDLERRWTEASIDDVLHEAGHLLAQPPPIQVYGRTYPVPRLVAWIGRGFTEESHYRDEIEVPRLIDFPIVVSMADRLSDDYGVIFDSVLLNLYRDGADSVGWHADNESSLGRNSPIPAVSLGASRRFRVRSNFGDSRTFTLDDGDLLVMGGSTQHHWKHSVPKMRCNEARLSITFRVCA